MSEIVWNIITHLPYPQALLLLVIMAVGWAILRIAPIIIIFLALFNQKVHDRLIALIQATKK